MLQLLAKAKVWYIDSTFKVVKEPLTQLLSIHFFVKSAEKTQTSATSLHSYVRKNQQGLQKSAASCAQQFARGHKNRKSCASL